MLQFTKEIKELWLSALKSGQYKHGKGRLRIDDTEVKHCCLGVLCEIHPRLSIKHSNAVLDDEKELKGYTPINEMIGEKVVEQLWNANDSCALNRLPGYEAVIPMIEQIPTVD